MNGDRRRWGAGAVAAWGAEAVVEEEPTVTMTLKAAEPLGYHGPVLQCRGVTVGYPGHRSLVQEFDLNIEVTSRIGLLGTNGSGKTSILSTIAKSLEPRGGEVFHYPRLGVGYFSQHQVEALPIKDTPLQFMASCSKGNEGVLRGHLASFGIGPGLVHHTIATLSGGEKTRLALAGITIKAPHVLLLDEPSNHLDLLTVQALGEALQGFQGGIVLVSHDRRLIDEVCKENYVVEDRQLKRCESLKGFLKKVARQSQ